MPWPAPNKICRIYYIDGQFIRADGLPVDMNHLYVAQDLDNPVEGEAWLYDGPFPDTPNSVTPPPVEDA